jgi:hypothetical protein
MTGRSYGTFGRIINGLGILTGSNALDVAKIGIDQALLTSNVSLLTDAYQRVHSELQIKNEIRADGIRADGSFGLCSIRKKNQMFDKIFCRPTWWYFVQWELW